LNNIPVYLEPDAEFTVRLLLILSVMSYIIL